MGLRDILVRALLKPPVEAETARYSMILPAEGELSVASERLIDTALAAIMEARAVALNDLSARMHAPPHYPDIWPGEHYKLLAGLMLTVKPRLVIEIGTFRGLSALAFKKYLEPGARIVTFDVVPWKSLKRTCLREEDFEGERLVQYTDDLSDPACIYKHRDLLQEADLIFIDAEKDGVMEQRFLDNLETIAFKNEPLVVFDDIRVWNMLRIWHGIRFPKLDLTSFGHWSGTGLVDWRPSAERPGEAS